MGRSDSGKTALIRALNWVINNQPLGDAFRSNWDANGETSVIIEVDGVRVGRAKKGTAQNLYTLDGKPFKAFGHGVPDEIKSFLNIHDVNIQPQITAPFLLSGISPGEVGRYFNRIARIEQIDHAISSAHSQIKANSKNRSLKNEDLDRDMARLDEFAWIDEADGYLSQMEALESQIYKLSVLKTKVKSSVVSIIEVKRRLKEVKRLIKAKMEIERLDDLNADIKAGNIQWGEINDILDKIEDKEAKKEWADKLIKAKPDLKKIENDYELIESMKIESDNILKTINTIKFAEKELTKAKEKQRELAKEWDEIAGDTCPICGGTI